MHAEEHNSLYLELYQVLTPSQTRHANHLYLSARRSIHFSKENDVIHLYLKEGSNRERVDYLGASLYPI